MKTKKIISIAFFAVFASSLVLFNSCKKEDKDDTAAESIQSAEDNAMAESEFSAVFDASDDVAAVNNDSKETKDSKSLGYTVLPSGAEVIFTDSLWSDGDGIAFFIDYGELLGTAPSGLLCKDGKYRAGRIDVTLSDHYYLVNSVLSISISEDNDYYVGDGTNMTHISGYKTVTRTDSTTRHIVVTDGKAESSLGTILWSCDRTTVRTADAGWGLWGDEFTTTGSAQGSNINGIGFTASISEEKPLVKQLQIGCARTFVSGIVTVTNNNGGVLELDYDPYGDQACDRTAKVTVNGVSRIIMVR